MVCTPSIMFLCWHGKAFILIYFFERRLIIMLFILESISNCTHYKMYDRITNPFPNFNGAVAVWEWVSNFVPHFTWHMITYSCWYLSQSLLVKGPLDCNSSIPPLIAKFMGPTWCPSGSDRTQMGPMLVPWTLLSGTLLIKVLKRQHEPHIAVEMGLKMLWP